MDTDVKANFTHTKDGLILTVLPFWVSSQHCTKVVIANLLLVRHHKLPPPLLASLALHLVLIDGGCGVEFREIGLQVLIDLIVELCKFDG